MSDIEDTDAHLAELEAVIAAARRAGIQTLVDAGMTEAEAEAKWNELMAEAS